jgi:hypothetical protein
MKLNLRVVSILSFIAAGLWFIVAPGYEALLAFITGIATLISSFLIDTQIKPTDHESQFRDQIDELNKVESSLLSFIEFVRIEKEKVIETENTLLKLRNEKDELEPIVNTNRQTVQAILDVHRRQNEVSVKRERLIGFALGVVSSLAASVLWELVVPMVR